MKTLNDILEDYESFSYREIEDMYAELLDEFYEPVNLAGMTINPSDMRTIDPFMFRCRCDDYSAEIFAEHTAGVYYRLEDYQEAQEIFWLEAIEATNKNSEGDL